MHRALRSNACNIMKSKRHVLFGINMIVIILSGCSLRGQSEEIITPQIKKDEIHQIDKEDGQLATKEFLIETFSVTEEDIKQLDII